MDDALPVDRDEGVIVVGAFHSPPFMESSPMRGLSGPFVDVGSQLVRDHARTPLLAELTQQRLLNFQSARLDIGLGVFQSPRRSKLGAFSRALFEIPVQGLSRQYFGTASLVELLAADVRVAVKEGDVGHEYVATLAGDDRALASKVVVVPAASSASSWHLLIRNECDLIICDELTLTNVRPEVPFRTTMAFDRSLATARMGLLVSRDSPISVAEVNAWLDANVGSRLYRGLVRVTEGFDVIVPVLRAGG